MKKTSYIWFGLAVPVVLGGVAAYFKTKKNSNGHEIIEETAEPSAKTTVDSSPMTEMLIEKPDLDKNINETAKPQSKPRPNIKTAMKSSEEKSSTGNARKIYTGSKGGKYYLNNKGKKVYLKK